MDYLYALQCIREAAPHWLNYLFVFISEFMIAGGVALAAVIYWCVDKHAGISVILSYAFSFTLNQTVKNIACVYRPWLRDPRLHVAPEAASSATGYSFPSGHTVTAASILGGISVWKRDSKRTVAFLSLLILLTAFSRNWLGAHTIADVVTALFVAAAGILAVNCMLHHVNENPGKDTAVFVAGTAVSVILLIFLNLKKYPADYTADGKIIADPYNMLTDCYTACGLLCGTLAGWWTERRFVNFTADGTAGRKILRGTAGIVILAVLYAGLGPALSFCGGHISHLIKYFVIAFFVTCGYPALVKAVENKSGKNPR